LNILIKYIVGLKMEKGRDMGYDSTREGAKGDKSFIVFYLPILFLVGKSGYMIFLGKAMWCFIACNYTNPTFGLFGGYSIICSFFIVPKSSLFVPHSFSLILGLGLGMEN
jgi:hypothetical protein